MMQGEYDAGWVWCRVSMMQGEYDAGWVWCRVSITCCVHAPWSMRRAGRGLAILSPIMVMVVSVYGGGH